MTNTLSIDVGKDKVRFLVNGTEVSTADAAKVDTSGMPGCASTTISTSTWKDLRSRASSRFADR
jgi:hypothetical protein